MKFNYDIFLIDIRKKQIEDDKMDNEIAKEIGIGKSTMSRIKNNKPFVMETFIKVLDWLGTDPKRYFKRIYGN